jgi:hypothetical protein
MSRCLNAPAPFPVVPIICEHGQHPIAGEFYYWRKIIVCKACYDLLVKKKRENASKLDRLIAQAEDHH